MVWKIEKPTPKHSRSRSLRSTAVDSAQISSHPPFCILRLEKTCVRKVKVSTFHGLDFDFPPLTLSFPAYPHYFHVINIFEI